MNRRDFLLTASLTALASSPCLSSNVEDSKIPIIDAHQHLWDLDLIPLQWIRPPIDKSFVTEDYLSAIRGQQVVKAIYMEVGAPEEYKKKEAAWALQLCKDPKNPTVGAVISANPTDSEFQSYIKTLANNPYLKGIRYPFKNSEEMMLPQVIENIRLLGTLQLSFDLNIPPHLLKDGVKLLEACPGTRFILNHCGNADPVAFFSGQEFPRETRHDPDSWFDGIALLSQKENVICKISGIVDNVGDYPLTASDLAPIINHCYEAFGADRVIFASDWPVCLRNMSLATWIGTLREVVADRPLADQRKLFHDNAQHFYGLIE